MYRILFFSLTFSYAAAQQMTIRREAVSKDATDMLLTAYENCNMEAIQNALRHGADINFKDQHGMTLLMVAARDGLDGMVAILLMCGANATLRNARDGNKSALEYTRDEGVRQELKRVMLEQGNQKQIERQQDADREEKKSESKQVLLTANEQVAMDHTLRMMIFRNSDAKVIRFTIQGGANPNAFDPHSGTPLMCARTAAMVEVLVESGACVDMRDQYGQTALGNAISFHWFEVVKALVAFGADTTFVRSRNKAGRRTVHQKIDEALALGRAYYGEHKTAVEEQKMRNLAMVRRSMQDQQIQSETLFDADIAHQVALIEQRCAIVARREKEEPVVRAINDRDHRGVTLLMQAASNGNIPFMRLLLKDPATDIHATDITGVPVLCYALISGCWRAVELLLNAGVDLAENDLYVKAQSIAQRFNDQEMAARLEKAFLEQQKRKKAQEEVRIRILKVTNMPNSVFDYVVKKYL